MKIFLSLTFFLFSHTIFGEECVQSDQVSINDCYGKEVLKDKSDRDYKFELFLSEFDKQTAEEGANLRNLAWDYFSESALHEHIFDSYSLKNVDIMAIQNSLDEEFIDFFISKNYQNSKLENVSHEQLNNKLEEILKFINDNYKEMEWENEIYKYVENEFSYPIFEKGIIDIHNKYLAYRDAYTNFYVKLNPAVKTLEISNHLNKSRLDRLGIILSEMKSGKSIN